MSQFLNDELREILEATKPMLDAQMKELNKDQEKQKQNDTPLPMQPQEVTQQTQADPLQIKQDALEQAVAQRKESFLKRLKKVFTHDGERSYNERIRNQYSRKESVWYLEAEIPSNDKLEEKIGDANDFFMPEKPLTKSEKEKRRKKFHAKAASQAKVLDAVDSYYHKRDKVFIEEGLFLNETSKLKYSFPNGDTMDREGRLLNEVRSVNGDRVFTQKMVENSEDTELVKDYVAYLSGNQKYKEGDIKAVIERFGAESGKRDAATILDCLRIIKDIDLSQFDYKNEEEFTKDLSKKIAALNVASHGDMLLEALPAAYKQEQTDHFEVQTKIEILKDIKKDYDSRIQLMQSPYYALLSSKDLSGLTAEELETKKKEVLEKIAPTVEEKGIAVSYLDSLQKRKDLGAFKQGVSSTKLYEESLKQKQKAEYEMMTEKIRTFAAEMHQFAEDNNLITVDFTDARFFELIRRFYIDKAKKTLPDGLTGETIKNFVPTEGTPNMGFETEDITMYNTLNQILIETKTVDGKPVDIDQSILDEMKVVQDKIIANQSELEPLARAHQMLNEFPTLIHYVLSNPYLKKDKKKLQALKAAAEKAADVMLMGRMKELKAERRLLHVKITEIRMRSGIRFGNDGKGPESDKQYQKMAKNADRYMAEAPYSARFVCADKEFMFSDSLRHLQPELKELGIDLSNLDLDLFKDGSKVAVKPKAGIEETEATYKALEETMKELHILVQFNHEWGQDWSGISSLEFGARMKELAGELFTKTTAFMNTVEIEKKTE
ncbi:MAG: hypothetical protein K6A69_05105 [Lachnospiraceae bacterium]|nr:hypothetical protein [Lachnospiraceae bacterium]